MVELRYAQGTSYHHNKKSRDCALLETIKKIDLTKLPACGLIRATNFLGENYPRTSPPSIDGINKNIVRIWSKKNGAYRSISS